jgi:hypothetical protein
MPSVVILATKPPVSRCDCTTTPTSSTISGATRHFYEDILGLPLVATWTEIDELVGAERSTATPLTARESLLRLLYSLTDSPQSVRHRSAALYGFDPFAATDNPASNRRIIDVPSLRNSWSHARGKSEAMTSHERSATDTVSEARPRRCEGSVDRPAAELERRRLSARLWESDIRPAGGGDEVLDEIHHLVRRFDLGEVADSGQYLKSAVLADGARGVRMVDGNDAVLVTPDRHHG